MAKRKEFEDSKRQSQMADKARFDHINNYTKQNRQKRMYVRMS